MATIHGPHLAQRAAQPGYRHQNQNYQPGLLQPGQVIHVNSYVVTIERYLSQGGFAHVYVVQSQAPINGTRQHVLKRIAVSNESMLRDVKKEVDVMKGLRGHPNIVNLIDATSIPSPNGTFEVFILMEFCPGGGIIDMMNRRLRERLTEAEILQIFVDVCEGVACMHNLKPPLIHRDLKVENILQASQASFKLCDFGSAVTVHPRPPSTTAELRALEADINRHTTFQYRAPEMIDVYLRRPVDEKSDVWALGVLLYKLCYYTTPFEEHGQLAIINVSYRIPSYPVYSNSMKVLIASTLQEHGAQRPTVFDLLEQVHRLRGTKPLFRYDRPKLSTLPLQSPATFSSTSVIQAKTYNPSSAKAAETQKQVFDALQPMRRGRPSVGTSLAPASAPLSPIKSGPSKITERPRRFSKPTADSVTSSPSIISDMNAWRIGTTHHPTTKSQPRVNGFEDSFQTSSSAQVISPSPSPKPPPLPNRNRPPPPARQHHRTGPVVPMNAKQGAFEALDPTLVSRPPPRTLGSLSISTSVDSSTGPGLRSPSAPYLGPKASKVTGDYLSYSSTSNKASRSPSSPSAQLSVEERFPSLEGLDQHFAKAGIGSPSLSSNKVSGKSSSSGLVLPTLGNTSSSQTSPAPDRFQASIRSLGSGTPAGTRTASTRPPSPSGPRSRSPLTSPEIRPRDLPPPSSYGMQQAGTRFATASFSPLSTRPSVEKLPGHGAKPPVNHATKPSLSKLDVGQSSSAPSSQSWSKESPGTPAVVAQTRNLLDEIFASDASLPSPLVASSTRHLVPPPVATSYRGDAPSIPKSQTPSPRLQGALRPPERRNSPRSGESSGGDENPEDPVPRRASRVWGVPRATSPSQSPNLIPSSTRGVSPTGSNPARKSYHGPSHARKTSAYDLIDAPPPTSNSVATHTGGQRSPSRQGRRQASAYDLVDIEKPLASSITQPMGTQLGQSPQDKQFTGSRVSHHDRQFTGNRVPGGTYSSPSLSPVPNPANAKIQGGPRPRPQSMFLTSSNLLIPPSVPSDVSTPNGTGASPRRESHRRLSISDMVSKYEEVVRGALAPEISRQGNVSKTPTGAFPLTKVTTPKLLPTTTPPSTSPSKAHATQPSSQYKPQRSPVMTSFPPSGLAQSTDPGPLNSPVTRSYTRPAANTPLQHTGLPTVKRLREPSPENEQQPSHAPRTESTKLNVVPPPDFTGRQDRPPSPARPGRVSPAAHSPTPERPYQGVSKLIDQWQKKSEAAMGESNVIGRKPLGSGRTFR